jgi:hypothetical protein
MRWLLWRQHRFELMCLALTLILCAALLSYEHLALASTFADHGLGQCASASSAGCLTSLNAFVNEFGNLNLSIYWMLVLPAVLGIFVGAPLVARELESGTFRFVWLQGVTRTRWFVAKVAALAVATMVAAVALSVVISWALEPLIRVEGILLMPSLNPLTTPLFDLTGVVLIASSVFALSVGVLAGTVIRTSVLAMLVTLVAFAAVAVPLDMYRPHLLQPQTAIAAIQAGSNSNLPAVPPGSWVLKMGFVDARGRRYDLLGDAAGACLPANDPATFDRCLTNLGIGTYVEYQPPDRFWQFQAAQAASYGGLSLVAVLAALWMVRRRIA